MTHHRKPDELSSRNPPKALTADPRNRPDVVLGPIADGERDLEWRILLA